MEIRCSGSLLGFVSPQSHWLRSSYSGSRGHLLSAPSTGKIFFSNLLKPAHLLLLTKVWSTPGLTFGKIRNGPTAIAFVGGGFAITIFSLLERTVLSKTVLKYCYEIFISNTNFEGPLTRISVVCTMKCISKHNN